MITIPFSLSNASAFARIEEILQFGVPCPRGLLSEVTEACVVDSGSQTAFAAAIAVSARWPDQSVKWLLVVSRVNVAAQSDARFELRLGQSVSSEAPQLQEVGQGYRIETGGRRLDVACDKRFPFLSEGLVGFTELQLANGKVASAQVREISVDHSLMPLKLALRQTGEFGNSGMHFISTLSVFAGTATVAWDFTVWNPQAARHPGGCWDLGDANSLRFKGLQTRFSSATSGDVGWKLTAEASWQTDPECAIYQESSGGENWQSRTHVNHQNSVPTLRRGFVLKTPQQQNEGLRAAPHMRWRSEQGTLQIHLSEFWQNFPKAMQADQQGLRLSFFPEQYPDPHELQPGERKTHRLWLSFSDDGNLDWAEAPLIVRIDPNWYQQSEALGPILAHPEADPLREILKESLDGPHNFFNKRERIDEYGWRHYGEVYADHETHYQKAGEAPLVSHYNNQYDAVMGFARQFVQTGDARWYRLMDELARHVSDIDLYHTQQDKVEYNGGLFWHTDHYLPAHTCTHRTFTRFSTTSSTPGQTGGGPGTEHCYASGLLWHFYLTGNPRSREAVLQLAQWMCVLHDGAESFLAQLWAAKKIELTLILARLKGHGMLPYRYPFTRGTGNFIVTLLDAYELSDDVRWLQRAEQVIAQTAHPNDDIARRCLEDIENTWSYVVFLQSLLKYLAVKESAGQFDQAWHYARQTLVHYAGWMLQHERPYREREEILEFPNDTWVAQEIRKAVILAQAARYAPAQSEALIARGRQFLEYLIERLRRSEERHYARVQIVLLQSYGAHAACLAGEQVSPLPQELLQDMDFGPAPKLSLPRTFGAMLLRILKGLRYLSPRRELEWLQRR